jgi:hypothetical protein
MATQEINWRIVKRCMKAYPEEPTFWDRIIKYTVLAAAWVAAAKIISTW